MGGIARLMGNFRLRELRLVDPRVDPEAGEVKSRALEAFSIVQNAKRFASLAEAVADLRWTVAYSMRLGGAQPPGAGLHELSSDFYVERSDWGMVFGREDRGLDAEELRRCSFQIQIPTDSFFPSINIVSAAAIALFDWYKHSQDLPARQSPLPRPKLGDEEIFFQELRGLLQGIGFIKDSKSLHIIKDLRDIYHRAEVNERDLRILFGIISDLKRNLGFRDPFHKQ